MTLSQQSKAMISVPMVVFHRPQTIGIVKAANVRQVFNRLAPRRKLAFVIFGKLLGPIDIRIDQYPWFLLTFDVPCCHATGRFATGATTAAVSLRWDWPSATAARYLVRILNSRIGSSEDTVWSVFNPKNPRYVLREGCTGLKRVLIRHRETPHPDRRVTTSTLQTAVRAEGFQPFGQKV